MWNLNERLLLGLFGRSDTIFKNVKVKWDETIGKTTTMKMKVFDTICPIKVCLSPLPLHSLSCIIRIPGCTEVPVPLTYGHLKATMIQKTYLNTVVHIRVFPNIMHPNPMRKKDKNTSWQASIRGG